MTAPISTSVVFPACAGMFLEYPKWTQFPWGFPRVRGDVPPTRVDEIAFGRFSPRARGCSAAGYGGAVRYIVFPACAGMFRKSSVSAMRSSGFPRVRGDVPKRATVTVNLPSVFPACAGMFLLQGLQGGQLVGFPRVRGDVPLEQKLREDPRVFSPRARGCSPLTDLLIELPIVFPACAGMFPAPDPAKGSHTSFPRVRGDVPQGAAEPQALIAFSPRARGCSSLTLSGSPTPCVFPACAGMFLAC